MISREEIRSRSVAIIRSCVPNLREAELSDSSVVNTDMGMDSMSFILVICKIEAEFGIKIPDRRWDKLKTLGEVLDEIEAALKRQSR